MTSSTENSDNNDLTAAVASGSDSGEVKYEGITPHPTLPHSNYVRALLTDLYQISMAYAYWHSGKAEDTSVFDLFFRKNPFKGEFTIFAGLEDCLRYVNSFGFSDIDVAALKDRFPDWDEEFWPFMRQLRSTDVKIFAIAEGTVVFPRVPLLRVEGPLVVCQLLETTLLNCVNYPSLIATNAARHRLAAGPGKQLFEFGLRRAQGADGAMTASKYAYVGGFDGTSNVLSALMYGFQCKGTHAHSFVVSFVSFSDLRTRTLRTAGGETVDFVSMVQAKQRLLDAQHSANEGELSAFIAYAQAYPSGLVALIDTYDTISSGLPNFLCVALALHDCGYRALGIRLDSGDLAYLSRACRAKFRELGDRYNVPYFADFNIVASNDLSEDVLYSLNEQHHSIDTFGIGTNLVTCLRQPALGCVYKLVEIGGKSRIKISEDIVKVTLPCRKEAYRLFGENGKPLLDLLIAVGHQPPLPHRRILCRHPFDAAKRAYVTPSRVEKLHELFWDGRLVRPFPTLEECRQRVQDEMSMMRADHLRRINPTPYKISLTSDLYNFMHELWLSECPIREIQ